jgi:hypothetical protein
MESARGAPFVLKLELIAGQMRAAGKKPQAFLVLFLLVSLAQPRASFSAARSEAVDFTPPVIRASRPVPLRRTKQHGRSVE